MPDARLQDLARRAATGGPEDRAAWLRGRLRAGTITRERVELAAYCGDEGARLVVPHWLGSNREPRARENFFGWLRGVAIYGESLRAAVAMAETALEEWEKVNPEPRDSGVRIAVELGREALEGSPSRRSVRFFYRYIRNIECGDRHPLVGWARGPLAILLGEWPVWGDQRVRGLDYTRGTAAMYCTDDALRAAVSAELIRWALS